MLNLQDVFDCTRFPPVPLASSNLPGPAAFFPVFPLLLNIIPSNGSFFCRCFSDSCNVVPESSFSLPFPHYLSQLNLGFPPVPLVGTSVDDLMSPSGSLFSLIFPAFFSIFCTSFCQGFFSPFRALESGLSVPFNLLVAEIFLHSLFRLVPSLQYVAFHKFFLKRFPVPPPPFPLLDVSSLVSPLGRE